LTPDVHQRVDLAFAQAGADFVFVVGLGAATAG
jgi:hypothetical protein